MLKNTRLVVVRRWDEPFQLGFIRGFLDNKAANNVTGINTPVPDPELDDVEDQVICTVCRFC